ncbi:MAG: SRPBCC family protein, partial [Pseudonocardiaceae bacterium]|nr:SRPBCC family protein [Pseudonocardiaceae bacterium]
VSTVAGIVVSRWRYEIEPTPEGCRVEERTWDLRPSWFRPLSVLVTGVRDRTEVNRRNMERTLRQLKSAAEAAHS